MTREIQTTVGFAEFYVEVMHARGNFTKFEFDGEELDVWDFRRRDHDSWHIGFIIAAMVEEETGQGPQFIITRYLDLEQDVLDTTYHPSVDSWNIDINKVKEHFTNGE